jgi:putative endonuclease
VSQWYLYMIRAGDGSLYTGVATDVTRRLAEHRTGGRRCARYLRGRGPLRLVYKRRLGSLSLALRAERGIKRMRKREKERIVRSNPGRGELIARVGSQLRETRS